MKAIVYDKYGSPDVLKLKDIEKPVPGDNEVLVKIHAAALNSADVDLLTGNVFGRISGLFKPSYKILGSDISGLVEAVGKNVKLFQPGDEVYGDMTNSGFGTFAEYKCVSENALMKKPSYMTFEEAAAIPSAGVIALQGIRSKRQIHPGDKVLINGAGGGMGTFAVQMAKTYGAEVTGVDRGEKLNKILQLGADHVIDYTKEDYTKQSQCYDLILDCQGFHSAFKYKRKLRPDGTYLMIGGSVASALQVIVIGPLISATSSKSVGLLVGRPNRKEDLIVLEELFESRKVVPVIDKSYPLSDVAEAFRYFEKGLFKGKIIITM